VRAMHGENLRKFTETHARAPRARHAVISFHPEVQYLNVVIIDRSTGTKNDLKTVCTNFTMYVGT
jgi:hypothetical protein